MFELAASGVERRNYQHRFTESIIQSVGDAYEAAQQFDKAEAWRRKWLANCKSQFGSEQKEYALALAALGGNLLLQKNYAEAEPLLRAFTVYGLQIADANPVNCKP